MWRMMAHRKEVRIGVDPDAVPLTNAPPIARTHIADFPLGLPGADTRYGCAVASSISLQAS